MKIVNAVSRNIRIFLIHTTGVSWAMWWSGSLLGSLLEVFACHRYDLSPLKAHPKAWSHTHTCRGHAHPDTHTQVCSVGVTVQCSGCFFLFSDAVFFLFLCRFFIFVMIFDFGLVLFAAVCGFCCCGPSLLVSISYAAPQPRPTLSTCLFPPSFPVQ